MFPVQVVPTYQGVRGNLTSTPYQDLYIQGRGALKRELVSCLRIGRALCVPTAKAQAKMWAPASEDVMISNRPAEVQHRAVPGPWGVT